MRHSEPWDEMGPREFKTGFGVVFGAWLMGLLIAGGVGLGTVFILKANDGEPVLWAHLLFGVAMMSGAGVVSGLLENPRRNWLVWSFGLTFFLIFLPSVGAMAFVIGVSMLPLALTGFIATVLGTVVGGKLTAYARFRES